MNREQRLWASGPLVCPFPGIHSGQWPAQLTQSLDSVQRSLLAGLWGPWKGRAVPSRLGPELWGLLVSRVSVHTREKWVLPD